MTNPVESTRAAILRVASELTTGDRAQTYGSPVDNMRCFADLVSAYLTTAVGLSTPLTPEHGAMIMTLAKIARTASPTLRHADNYIDGAAYFAIAGECAGV
jgi:hypothetical protein